MNDQSGLRARRRQPLLILALVGAGLVAASVFLDRSMREGARARAAAELDAVAALQAGTIVRWRDEHLRNVAYAAAYPSVVRGAGAARDGRIEPALAAHLVEILGHFGGRHDYLRVELLDAQARPLATWRAPADADRPFDRELVDLALAGGTTATFRHHERAEGEWDVLDAAVAVRPPGGPACAVALRVAMGPFLEDLLARWPSAGVTASTGLIRRSQDGRSAVVFGAQARAPGGQPAYLVPLEQADRLAVRALLAGAGISTATDFRGQRVLAATRPVPGTGWVLVSKMDLAEIEAPLVEPAGAIFGLLAALLLAGAVALLAWWWQDRRRGLVAAALRESQERLRLALGDAVWVWDWDLAAGRFTSERPAALWPSGPMRHHGTLEEVLARVVEPEDVLLVRERLAAHLRGEVPGFASEHRVRVAEGGARWVLARGRVVERDAAGRPQRLLGVASDVTERRAMQAQLERTERMAGLGTLAAGVAHEINNPLAALLADLDVVARSGTLEPEAGAALADARDAAERVLEVARSLRTFAGQGSGRRGPADVLAEVDAAIRLARNVLRHRARLVVRLGPLPRVVAARHELGQVFLNLLVNAAQAIPEGRAEEAVVTVEARTDEAGWAVVEVRDTGGGIPPEVLSRLFQPFQTTKPQGVGTGLGLAIAHAIVAAAGGRIEVETKVGAGSTFRVLLPPARAGEAAAPGDEGPPPAAAAPAPGAEAPRPLRVLVVDDDPLVARAVVRSLGRGHEVTVAATAQEALASLRGQGSFDAILCDLMMPQMTGMELHARLAAERPELVDRVVFVTGGAFTERAAEFLRRPDIACVEKPFAPATLREAVSRVARGAGPAGGARLAGGAGPG